MEDVWRRSANGWKARHVPKHDSLCMYVRLLQLLLLHLLLPLQWAWWKLHQQP